nr:hypothetical protein HK105_002412 [Polyrhizophydium stewartii]
MHADRPLGSFTITDAVGSLDDILSLMRRMNISLTRIESRPSKTKGDYDFFIDFLARDDEHITSAVKAISQVAKSVKFELDADHPGFTDPVYRKRRQDITEAAKAHRHGQPLPRVNYTPEEIKTWGVVFNKLTAMYKTHACYEHQYIFPLLVQNCGYSENNIPQLEDISRFLRDCTGWTLRPVMGLLSSRDFLNALAFRVFHSTQYIRHHSSPLYTPEPDVCHELLGHVPLYADPDFAAFSQDLKKLATIYWFTVEFGLCRQGTEVRAYGAGLLSSFGELDRCPFCVQYSLSSKPQKLPFDCATMAVQPYPYVSRRLVLRQLYCALITEYQPVYFVADSFKQMKDDVREYALGLDRPFTAHYNALTQSVELLDTKERVTRFANTIKGDLTRLISAMDKVIRE